MSDAKAEGAKEEKAAKPKGPGMGAGALLAILNFVFILAALGTLVYTRVLFKRPKITEDSERSRIEAQLKKEAAIPKTSGTVSFDPFTINVSPKTKNSDPNLEPMNPNTLHYVTLGFALEITDDSKRDFVEAIKPLLLDAIILQIARSDLHEISTVQGRYVLRSFIIEKANEILAQGAKKDPGFQVTNIYLNQFVVQ